MAVSAYKRSSWRGEISSETICGSCSARLLCRINSGPGKQCCFARVRRRYLHTVSCRSTQRSPLWIRFWRWVSNLWVNICFRRTASSAVHSSSPNPSRVIGAAEGYSIWTVSRSWLLNFSSREKHWISCCAGVDEPGLLLKRLRVVIWPVLDLSRGLLGLPPAAKQPLAAG